MQMWYCQGISKGKRPHFWLTSIAQKHLCFKLLIIYQKLSTAITSTSEFQGLTSKNRHFIWCLSWLVFVKLQSCIKLLCYKRKILKNMNSFMFNIRYTFRQQLQKKMHAFYTNTVKLKKTWIILFKCSRRRYKRIINHIIYNI